MPVEYIYKNTYLQNLLRTAGNIVMFRADNVGVEDTWRGVEGVDSRVDTKLGNTSGEHSRCVQVGEGRRRGWISQIISGHVYGLYTCVDTNYVQLVKYFKILQLLY